MGFLQTAQDCIARGWYIFPLRPRGKNPVISKAAGGRGFHDAVLDPAQVEAWWTQYKNANVGIACGASDLYVVDCDYGLETFEEFEAWRMRNNIPRTYTVRTGRLTSFAVQMYFQGALESNGKWELDGCKGEIRSTGGLVMAVGNIHPDTGEVYKLIVDAPLAPRPGIFEESIITVKHVLAERAPGQKISENRNMTLLSEVGKYRRRNPDASPAAALAFFLVWNDENFDPPLSSDEVETVVNNGYSYEAEPAPPTVTIGKAPAPAKSDVEIIEELDPKLTATPLPQYPLDIFDGTLYGEFSVRAAAGNFVPREFFIEGAMTYAGAVCDNRLRGMTEEITSRLYTVLLGVAGIGKGTTFRRIRKFVPPSRLLNDVAPKTVAGPCSVLMDRAGSENGLNDALLKHCSVIEDFEEMDRLMEKTTIKGSGGALMSIIRSCFDDVVPGITTTQGRKIAASLAYLSLLGAMTPSLWRQAMEGKDSYGSGLGGRFNLVATNEDRTASTLLDMDVGDLHNILDRKFTALQSGDLVIPTEDAALKILREWWDDNAQGKPYYNRVNVIAHRKALHIAWMRDLPVITAEVMGQALRLGDYLVKVREAFAVVKGEDRTAINENKVLNILKNIAPRAIRAKQVGQILDGQVSRASVYRALESLADSGEAEKIQRKEKTGRPFALFRVNLTEV